ncbi:hypothetical protein F0562_011219 [Nyssa sinensis]|uniref:FAS1 domain-containing protein n=1 Tax=Nyssa sinensis TaxID=561372 RepID=A0A5J5A409_9ASTE|nr:hypothetical protein F0562_011219 [Nyssa sinensis]
MSLAVGAVSSSTNMGFDENKEAAEKSGVQESGDESEGNVKRSTSEAYLYATEDEEEDEDGNKIELGPQYTLKEQLEKDKDDESLRRWKEQLLGTVDVNNVGETLEPEVKIVSLSIVSPDRSDIFLPIPEDGNPKGLWFTLKEGCRYSLRFFFEVSNNIVSGLKYTNTVWKTGMKVDSTKEMLGTFSPQQEPYTHEMPEETTPSGFFARGSYSAKSRNTFLSLNSSLSGIWTYAQTVGSPSLSPSPAPAPAPDFVNLTDLLTVAGPFHTFLGYLESTKVIETFQNQANNTEEGITIFVPKDDAFSSLKNPSLSNLTGDQLKSLCLFHALSHYYSLADFKNLSQLSPVSTLAGGQYTLNFTDVSGTAHLSSGWTNTKVSSSVHSTDPVAVYQVDKVLLPEAIFGTDIPPTPAPAPSPDIVPAADTPSVETGRGSSPTSSPSSSSYRIISWGMSPLVLAISGGLILFL